MYEFNAGTGRLVNALDRLKADKERLRQLADLIFYYPEQLEQDITAACDYYEAFANTERPRKEDE